MKIDGHPLGKAVVDVAQKDEFSPFFQRMLEAPDTAIAAIREDVTAFENHVENSDAGRHIAQAALPNRTALGFALFDAGGEAMAIERPDWLPEFATLDMLLQHVDPRSSDGRLLCIERPDRPPLFGLWAPWAETLGWNLPDSLRRHGELENASAVALFAGGMAANIRNAASAFGLPPLQQRLVEALVRTGSVKVAASQLNISYATAREAMASAAHRMRLANTPAVVQAVVEAAFGILPREVAGSVVFADTLGISERQARVALHIASGHSREATAAALGTSTAVIRKELQLLYSSLGVRSATDLARLITEMQALRLFARSVDNAPGFLDPAIEPSRFSVRPNSHGLIGWSDYGPASGKPVLIVHSNWCCRAVPVKFVRELQSAGWRPIAIDRPGFGATHIGTSTRADPFSQAVADTLQILAEIKVARIPIVAHCGAQFVHTLAARAPDRVGPVILISPTPQASESGSRRGSVGAFKEAFYRSPRLVELLFRVISSQFTFERVERLMHFVTRGSTVDAALCEDPQFLRDRFRALRPFACGGYEGGILEEFVISQGGWPFEPLKGGDWTILQGAEDYHNETAEVADFWCKLLPEAFFEKVEGGGRFLMSSHPELVVERLNEALVRGATARPIAVREAN